MERPSSLNFDKSYYDWWEHCVYYMRTICDMGVGGPGLTPVELGGQGPGVLCPGPDLLKEHSSLNTLPSSVLQNTKNYFNL